MYKFLLGFAGGLYVATYYDCKPYIVYTIQKFQENIPKEKKEDK